jgi:integrase/recombinase XerD
VYFCQSRDWIAHFKVSIPKARKKIKETYTVEELDSLIFSGKPNTKKCSFSEYKTWAFESYLLATGNRLSTALNVKIKDVNFENKTIYLCETKNRKEQIIPLSPQLALDLREYLEFRKGEADDYLFCNEYGEKASDRTYQQLVRRYNTKRNVEKTSIHVFRHTFAKQWVLASGDIARLQKILGHASLSTTNEYLNMFGQDLQTDFDKFNPLDNLKARR